VVDFLRERGEEAEVTGPTTDRPLRPRNRRELIAEAAGRAFSERGYHAVGMDDIAATVGITAAALYRHYPNKYALFVHCATRLVDGLAESLDALPEDADLDDILRAVARTTVANRATGGICRWEVRHLEAPERDALRASFARVVSRVASAVAVARAQGPDRTTGPGGDAPLLAAAALGAIGSATAHRTTVGARRMEELLASSARRVALAPAPVPESASRPPPSGARARVSEVPRRPSGPAPGDVRTWTERQAEILHAAIPLFHRNGYTEASMGDIARAVGLSPSGLYRHYPGKADILAAACLEAADVLRATVDRELAGAGDGDALPALARAYVDYSFEHTALTSVATAEMGGLPPELQRPLRAAQRGHVALWEEHLRAARPDLDTVDARVLVHAGLGVVTEAGRALHWEDAADHRRVVVALVLAALGA
jgi:AcrR family transcriptional regulator